MIVIPFALNSFFVVVWGIKMQPDPIIVLSVYQCLFEVPLKTILRSWLVPDNHIIQLYRYASSPIIEGVVNGNIKD